MAAKGNDNADAREAMEELATFLDQEESFCGDEIPEKEANYVSLRSRYLLAVKRLCPDIVEAKNDEERSNSRMRKRRKDQFEEEFDKCDTFIELRLLWDEYEEGAKDRPETLSPEDKQIQAEIDEAEDKVVEGFVEYSRIISKDVDENDERDEHIHKLVVQGKKMRERADRRRRKKEKAEQRRQSRLELERLKTQDSGLVEEAKRLKQEAMNSKSRAKSVMAAFEKTISTNQEHGAGVCSGMYLSNIALSPKKRAPKLRNAKMTPRSRRDTSERSTTETARSTKTSRSSQSAWSKRSHDEFSRGSRDDNDDDQSISSVSSASSRRGQDWDAFDPFSSHDQKFDETMIVEVEKVDDDSFEANDFDFEDVSFSDSTNCSFTAGESTCSKRLKRSKSAGKRKPRAQGYVDSDRQLSSVRNIKSMFDTGQQNDLIKKCHNPSNKEKLSKGTVKRTSKKDAKGDGNLDNILKKDKERLRRSAGKSQKSDGSRGSKETNSPKNGSEEFKSPSKRSKTPETIQKRNQSPPKLPRSDSTRSMHKSPQKALSSFKSPSSRKLGSSDKSPDNKWISPSQRQGRVGRLNKQGSFRGLSRDSWASKSSSRLCQTSHDSRPSWARSPTDDDNDDDMSDGDESVCDSVCGSVCSVQLAPSNRDRGDARRRHFEKKKEEAEQQQQQQEMHVPIKLRKAQSNRKSNGRKRKTKRTSNNTTDDLNSSLSSLDCSEVSQSEAAENDLMKVESILG